MLERVRFNAQKILPIGAARVDRENRVIYETTAMTIGRSRDEREMGADLKTLRIMANLGNAKTMGVLGRFGHPGWSENAMGKQVMRAKNFKVIGDRLVHDAHLLDVASLSPVFAQDPVEYLMRMAEENPDDLGESVVILTDLVWVLEDEREFSVYDDMPDDVEMENGRPVNATSDYPIMRPIKFYNVDFVMEGALTDGLFEQFARDIFSGTVNEDLFELFRTCLKIPVGYNCCA